ncbi:MAG: TadE family protein [Chloroflexota bacterium]|nr:TadE family protein [Chloroflexota bacterium]
MKKLLHILDGTPAVYGKRQAGQSMVELAMVTPLLIILLAGLVEIGWFANNYLSLLDVTRSGARRATVLVDQQAPNAADWLNEFTYVPHSLLADADEIAYRMPYVIAGESDVTRQRHRWEAASATTGACNPSFVARLFYNEVICTMIISLEPLALDADNGVDDIIVSGFSVEMVDASIEPLWLPAAIRPVSADTPQMVVAGRYPTEANECDVVGPGPTYAVSPRELRDPFDINDDGIRDNGAEPSPIDGDRDFEELEGFDAPAATVGAAEKQVGFSLFGNHKIPNSLCIGSEWLISDIERLMNLPSYTIDTADPEAREKMPGQGIALVEMYWEHEMLLQIPVLSPVFTAVGNAEGKMVVYVWAAFPLPAVEPFIVFPG